MRNEYSYNVGKLHALLEWDHFCHYCHFLFWDPTQNDPILHVVVIFPQFLPVCNKFPSFSLPGLTSTSLKKTGQKAFVDCPPIWVCPVFFFMTVPWIYIFRKHTIKMKWCPQCILSRCLGCHYVSILRMSPLITWLGWCFLVSPLKIFPS